MLNNSNLPVPDDRRAHLITPHGDSERCGLSVLAVVAVPVLPPARRELLVAGVGPAQFPGEGVRTLTRRCPNPLFMLHSSLAELLTRHSILVPVKVLPAALVEVKPCLFAGFHLLAVALAAALEGLSDCGGRES